MIPDIRDNYPYSKDDFIIEATRELDEEFPGASVDDSLQKYQDKQNKNKLRKEVIKELIFHGIFYTIFVIGFNFLFRKNNISLSDSMLYGLIWFLFHPIFMSIFYIYLFFKEEINETNF